MGLPIVSSLVRAGVPVVAGDREAGRAAAVRATGGTWCRRLDVAPARARAGERGVAVLEAPMGGGPDTGYVTKLLVNLLWFGQAIATTEVLLLADRGGLDVRTLLGALGHSAAHTRYLDTGARAHLDGDLMPSFGLERICAELAAVTALADVHGVPFQLSRLVRSVHERALDRYGPAHGELLACRYLEDLTATRLDAR